MSAIYPEKFHTDDVNHPSLISHNYNNVKPNEIRGVDRPITVFQFIGTLGSIVLQRVIFPCSLLFPSAMVYYFCFHLCGKNIDGRNCNSNLFQLQKVVRKCKGSL